MFVVIGKGGGRKVGVCADTVPGPKWAVLKLWETPPSR